MEYYKVMKMKKLIILALALIIIPLFLNAKIIGYRDRDKNKINDLFRDANGDGINDITGKKYKHSFPFIDKNKDGINDVFIDVNGDGFNDVKSSFYRKLYKCIDFNHDGINDITGKRYKAIAKTVENILKIGKFIKVENNSGEKTKYRKVKTKKTLKRSNGKYDTFIDKNKNGIDDRREEKKTVIIKKSGKDEEK